MFKDGNREETCQGWNVGVNKEFGDDRETKCEVREGCDTLRLSVYPFKPFSNSSFS